MSRSLATLTFAVLMTTEKRRRECNTPNDHVISFCIELTDATVGNSHAAMLS